MTRVPEYIAERVRRSVPEGCSVIPGSTPVVSFGNAETAWVATLGLNPSLREFTDARGNWLTGTKRRLATPECLGVTDLTQATDDQVAQVVADCYSYFQRSPFWWFKALENLMQDTVASSFYDGTACHLDLVQLATGVAGAVEIDQDADHRRRPRVPATATAVGVSSPGAAQRKDRHRSGDRDGKFRGGNF